MKVVFHQKRIFIDNSPILNQGTGSLGEEHLPKIGVVMISLHVDKFFYYSMNVIYVLRENIP